MRNGELVYSSIGGKIHYSLRTRGPQTVRELARWLHVDAYAVINAIKMDDRIGWKGHPGSRPGDVRVRLVTKEGVKLWPV